VVSARVEVRVNAEHDRGVAWPSCRETNTTLSPCAIAGASRSSGSGCGERRRSGSHRSNRPDRSDRRIQRGWHAPDQCPHGRGHRYDERAGQRLGHIHEPCDVHECHELRLHADPEAGGNPATDGSIVTGKTATGFTFKSTLSSTTFAYICVGN
jgi:hypothetical protein